MRIAIICVMASVASWCAQSRADITDDSAKTSLQRIYARFEGDGCTESVRNLLDNDLESNTNRLVRLAKEICGESPNLSKDMICLVGEFGSPTDIQFLQVCATNGVLGHLAVEQIFRIDGFSTNYIDSVGAFLNSGDDASSYDKSLAMSMLVNVAKFSSNNELVGIAQQMAYNYASTDNGRIMSNDCKLVNNIPSYQYSTNRLAVLRSVLSLGVNEHQIGFVTNTIHELETLLEQN